MKARRSTSPARSGLIAMLGDLPRRHRRAGGFVAVLASMALIVSMTAAGAYADDQPAEQPSAPATSSASAEDTASVEPTPDQGSEDAGDKADDTSGDEVSPSAPSSSTTDDSEPADEPKDESKDESSGEPSWVATPLTGLGGLVTAQSQSNGSTDVTITKRTFRGNTTKVVGAKFELRPYSSGQTTPPAGGSVGSCTINSGTSCTVSVANTGWNQSNNKRFWVVETTAPAGTSAVAKIGTGNASAVTEANPYPGLTPVLGATRSNNNGDYSVAMPADGYQLSNSSGSSLEQSDSAGFVANRLDNVAPNVQCNANLNIALVLDKSGSIYGYGGNDYRTSYKNGVGQLLDTLGTSPNTRVAAFTFGTSASKLVSLGTPSSIRSTVVNDIGGTSYANGTNWDAGLRLVDSDSANYDVVIFVTDGAPNYYYGSSLRNVEFSPTEEAILSANALKADGMQMIAVGVGAINSNPAGTHNLDAIAGPVDGQSQTYIGDWDELGEQLAGIAQDLTCQGTVKIVKNTVSAGGTTSSNVGGWTFNAANTAASSGGTPAAGNSSKQTVAGSGASWSYQFGNKQATTDVSFTETAQPGYGMTSVQCTGGTASAVNLANGTFKVAGVTSGSNVTCTVTNSQAKGSLEITKYDATTGNPVPSSATGMVIRLDKNPLTGAAGSFDVTDNGANDADSTVGVIRIDNALLGSYQVTELTAPAGYLLPSPNPAKTVNLTTSGAKVTARFDDPRKWQPLTATKTAAGSYDASYAWSITKKVKDAQGNWVDEASKSVAASGATGQAGFDYQVQVAQGARTISNVKVAGKISVTNPNSRPVDANLADSFPGFACVVNGGTANVTVPANSTQAYDYTCTGPNSLPANGTNTATVTWSKSAYPQAQGDVGASGSYTATPTAAVTFAEGASTNKTVTVTDDKHDFSADPQGAWTITWTQGGGPYTRTYSRTLTANAGTCTGWDENTAQVKNGQGAVLGSDKAKAKLCVGADLTVAKTATGSFTRTYLWNVRKVACDVSTPTDVTLCDNLVPQLGSPANPNYTVEVTPGQPQTTGYQMTGSITVANPNDWQDVTLSDIQDDYLGSTGEVCSITTAKPWTVPAGGSRSFAYECTFAQATPPTLDGINKATVTWDKAAAHTPSGTATGQHTLDPDAEWTETPVNKTIHVYDQLTGGAPTYLGSVTWTADLGPTYFHPTHDNLTAPVGQCQSYTDTAWMSGSQSPTAPVLGSDDATVKVCASHFTLDKSVSPSGTVKPGDTLTYTLTVHNDSQAVQSGFSVTDDLTGVLANAGDPTDLTPSVGNASFTSPTLSWSSTADLAPNASVTLTYKVKVKADAWNKTLKNVATPGTGGDCVAPGECTTTTVTPHYTLQKSSDKGETVMPGDVITYTLKVHNDSQGTVPGFTVTDNLADVLDDATLVQPLAAGLSVSGNTLTWTHAGNVAPNGDVTISYQATVKATAWNATIKNAVTPGTGGDCLPGKCETTSLTPHYVLSKEASPNGTVMPGDEITYTLTVKNDSQATLPGFTVKDDLSDVVDDASAPVITAPPAGQTATYSSGAKELTWTSTNALAKGDSVTLVYKVTVKADAWNATIKNAVTPGDGGDCQPGKCTTTDVTPHYTLEKSSSPASGSTVMPGDEITYTLKVTNDSQATLPGFTVKDDLSDVVDDASAPVITAPPAGQTATYDGGAKELTWTSTNALGKGDSVTLVYKVTVKAEAWKATLKNVATPGDGGDCLPGKCTTTDVTPHYTLSKSASPSGTVMPGDEITYTLTVHNDSDATLPGFSVEDDLSDVVDDASDPVVTAPPAGQTATYSSGAEKLTWSSTTPLAKGDSVTLTYKVTVDADAWNVALKNAVTPGDGGDCLPGECTTTSLTPHYTLEKSSDKGQTVMPGDEITYTLTVTNDSQTSLPGFTVKDDLSDVVDDAGAPVITAPPAGQTATYDGGAKELTWSSTNALGKGDSVTLTYKVTVGDTAWNATLKNVATPGDGGDCVPDKCETVSATPHYRLAKTSVQNTQTVQPGTVVDYSLTVTNDSQATLPGFEIVDDLSAVVSHTSAPVITAPPAGQTATYDGTAKKLTWSSTNALGKGDSVTLTYKVTINADAWNQTIHNVATPKQGTGGDCATGQQGACDTVSYTPPQVSPPVVKPPTTKPPTVKPPKSLPSTGGPASVWLYGGLGLVLLGGVLLLGRRRRSAR